MKKIPSFSILIAGAVLITVIVLATSCNTIKSGCKPAKQGKTHDKNVRFNN